MELFFPLHLSGVKKKKNSHCIILMDGAEPHVGRVVEEEDHSDSGSESESAASVVLTPELFERLFTLITMLKDLDYTQSANKAMIRNSFDRHEWNHLYQDFLRETQCADEGRLDEFIDQNLEVIFQTAQREHPLPNLMGMMESMGIATAPEIEAVVDIAIVLAQRRRAAAASENDNGTPSG